MTGRSRCMRGEALASALPDRECTGDIFSFVVSNLHAQKPQHPNQRYFSDKFQTDATGKQFENFRPSWWDTDGSKVRPPSPSRSSRFSPSVR